MIVFCHFEIANLESSLKKVTSVHSDFSWGILGENYEVFEKLYLVFGENKRDQEIGPLYQSISRNLRTPVLEYMGMLSKNNHSIKWWCTGLASKSIFHQNLFKMICYIKLVQVMEKEGKNLILYVADFGHYMSLSSMFHRQCKFITDKSKFYQIIRTNFRYFIQKALMVARLIIQKLMLIGQTRKKLDMETLVFSWITEKSFTPDVHYKDLWGGIFFDEFSKHSTCKRLTYSFVSPKALKKSFLSDAAFV